MPLQKADPVHHKTERHITGLTLPRCVPPPVLHPVAASALQPALGGFYTRIRGCASGHRNVINSPAHGGHLLCPCHKAETPTLPCTRLALLISQDEGICYWNVQEMQQHGLEQLFCGLSSTEWAGLTGQPHPYSCCRPWTVWDRNCLTWKSRMDSGAHRHLPCAYLLHKNFIPSQKLHPSQVDEWFGTGVNNVHINMVPSTETGWLNKVHHHIVWQPMVTCSICLASVYLESEGVATAWFSQYKKLHPPFSWLFLHVLCHAHFHFSHQHSFIHHQLSPHAILCLQ